MPKISAFIIARNEQDNIARALKSLLSFCDEIILVDTGSTDKTKEIALNYTDKIFDFKWVDDFSAARNFALSKCTGDWIIYL
ncbi:MAG TPA: glycosyltransferase, partial [Candidatus Gracilibacteria bacterium]|nr:glycosyltransferase [Candidatus Gracilibacteria bacterium]